MEDFLIDIFPLIAAFVAVIGFLALWTWLFGADR